MTKQQKTWLAVGALAVVAVALFAFKKKEAAPVAPPQEGGGSETPATPCPKGEVKCANSDKCYDPNANYLVDPCA